MQRSRRLVIGAVATGLLAAGAVTASMQAAHANVVQFCDGNSGDIYKCAVTGTVADPGSITVAVTANPNEDVAISWTVSCTDSTGTASEPTGGAMGMTTLTEDLALPATADGTCDVSATTSLPSTVTKPGDFTAELSFTPAPASPTASPPSVPASVHPIKGYAGMCVDDNGNSSALRSKVQIWKCSATDQAQSWTYSNGELKHNSKCANDQAVGGSGSHVILWTCNGASNEKWTHLANGELKLAAHGGALCLDDPAYSTKDGTQLIVYTCKDSSNQKWSLP